MPDAIGAWRIRDFAPGDGTPDGEGGAWIPATAPGDTYQALIAAGRLADPYVARNEARAAWVRDRAWWWHAPIELAQNATGETVELVCEGLDTFADVYCDGVLLGRADNMFRTWRFDLSAVSAGTHDLAVCFHPTAQMVAPPPPAWGSFTDRISASRRTMMRKAQFGWGWDWGPDLPTVGIWRPVQIVRGATVRSLEFATLVLENGTARVRMGVELSQPAPVTLDLADPAGRIVASASFDGSGSTEVTVADPQLWWTADLGAQPLYALTARIAGATACQRQVGIRTIAIDQSPDLAEPGTTFFRFVLNGVPIFAKGANWVPADACVGTIADGTYVDLLTRAVAANMNMMRVWGGGIYEPDVFYETCDRIGLLVWQDFMFACAPYPDDAGFLNNVRGEIAEQVARLRHHPCLALWCGNNENQAIQFFENHATGTQTPLLGQGIYDDLIPAVLAQLDPVTPYWPTSPWGGPSPNSMRGGDVHNWTVWHGIPLVPDSDVEGDHDRSPAGIAYTRYAEDMARFVSEFGIQGAPDIGTLRRWMAPGDLMLGSQGFLDRIKDVADKMTAMMVPVTGVPTTIEDYVAYSMLTQAEGLAFGIEHYRRRKPHCSGALIWQHNDCWPCVSWSLIDYDGVAKASLYAVTRAFAPVMASFRRVEGATELWVTNDTLTPIEDTATIALERLAGGRAWTIAVPFVVSANASECVWRGKNESDADHILTVRGGTFPANRMVPVPIKDLALAPDPELTMHCEQVGDALHVTITAARYALAVHLRSDDPALRFDDNHFDLVGSEERVIIVTHRNGAQIAPETLELACWNQRITPQ